MSIILNWLPNCTVPVAPLRSTEPFRMNENVKCSSFIGCHSNVLLSCRLPEAPLVVKLYLAPPVSDCSSHRLPLRPHVQSMMCRPTPSSMSLSPAGRVIWKLSPSRHWPRSPSDQPGA